MPDRPLVGQLLMFNAFPRTDFCKAHIYNGSECKVIGNLRNTVRVLFRGATITDIVAPEYLRIVISNNDKKAVRRSHDA